MKPQFIKVEDFLNADKENYLIVKILSNKFALVRSRIISEEVKWSHDIWVAGLDNGRLYTYGSPDVRAQERYLEQTTNTEKGLRHIIDKYGRDKWKVFTINNSRIRMNTRKLIRLLRGGGISNRKNTNLQ